MKIITFATHSEGFFDKLPSEVVVLGFGTKWEGFIERAKSIKEYLLTLPDDEIIVVIDGFDSIVKNTNIVEKFKEYDCKILISMEDKSGLNVYLPRFVQNYIVSRIFGTCKDNITACAGLLMGYNEYLKKLYDIIIHGNSEDDQRNINQSCNKLPFLKIDTLNKVFENCSDISGIEKSKACICQLPANITLNRALRSMIEYPKYFIPEIITFLLIVVIVLNFGKIKKVMLRR